MNITFKDNIPFIFCHECQENIEVSDLVNRGDSGLHCKFCNSHLGYIGDLPEKFREFVVRG